MASWELIKYPSTVESLQQRNFASSCVHAILICVCIILQYKDETCHTTTLGPVTVAISKDNVVISIKVK
jgi:hypothetical protein